MKDRISLFPGRVTLTPVAGQANTYDMVRADQPTQEGSALNKAFFLPDELVAELGINLDDPKVADALRALLDANGDTVAAMPQIAIGSYTGNFSSTTYTTQTRSIDLGLDFAPDMVLVYYQYAETTALNFNNNSPNNITFTANPRHIPNPMAIYVQGTTISGKYDTYVTGSSTLNGAVLSSSFYIKGDSYNSSSIAAKYAAMNNNGNIYHWIAFKASGR